MKFNELIISSGGIKGISLIGALNELHKNYPIYNFNYLTGCSIGAIICFLINIDYTIDEINDICMKINFESFQNLKIMNFIEKCGLDDGTKITNLLKAIIINKNYNINLTFKELFEKTNKLLTITTVNISSGKAEYHNYLTEPDLNILLSLRMSTNIPIVFSPIIYKNNYYIDGAFLDPYPFYYHKNVKKIGIWLFEKENIHFFKNNYLIQNNFINSDPLNYFVNLLNILYLNYIKNSYKKIAPNTIYVDINLENNISFKLDEVEKKKLFQFGIKKSKLFFKKLYKKRRIKYLIQKYYYLWRCKIKKDKK